MPFIHAHQDFFVASVNHAFLSHFFPNQFCFGMGQLGEAVPVPDSLAGKPSLR